MSKMPDEQNIRIIESGSNENGNYVKYSDGTLICRGSVIIEANSIYKTVKYPHDFVDTGVNIVLTNVFYNSKAIIYSIADGTKSKIDIFPWDVSKNAVPSVAVSARWEARGHWK